MSNNYKEEFDEIITVERFKEWIDNNSSQFTKFYSSLKGDASLSWWIHTFLLWSEYEDNKYE